MLSQGRDNFVHALSQWKTTLHYNVVPHWPSAWCFGVILCLNLSNPQVYVCISTISWHTRVTLYTAGHLHIAVPHCSHSRAPIVHTAVPRENNEHGCVYLRCRAVCKLPGCVEGHPCIPRNRYIYQENRAIYVWKQTYLTIEVSHNILSHNGYLSTGKHI